MSIVAKKAPQREQVPAGSHVARCIKIIHFGTAMESNHLGERVQRNTVRLTWEIPGEMRTFDEEQGPQPMSISKDYTLSLHEKANLRADLEGWRGQGFTPDELEGFDILNVQGQPCMLSIIHVPSKKTGNIYARIVGVSRLPKDTVCPENINPLFVWDYDQNYDEGVLANLHEWFQEKIKASDEYKAKVNPVDEEGIDVPKAPMPGLDDVPPEGHDDLPF